MFKVATLIRWPRWMFYYILYDSPKCPLWTQRTLVNVLFHPRWLLWIYYCTLPGVQHLSFSTWFWWENFLLCVEEFVFVCIFRSFLVKMLAIHLIFIHVLHYLCDMLTYQFLNVLSTCHMKFYGQSWKVLKEFCSLCIGCEK